MYSVSDIKLIRTDTTLDLSQKAEKVCRLFWFDTCTQRVLPGQIGASASTISSVCALQVTQRPCVLHSPALCSLRASQQGSTSVGPTCRANWDSLTDFPSLDLVLRVDPGELTALDGDAVFRAVRGVPKRDRGDRPADPRGRWPEDCRPGPEWWRPPDPHKVAATHIPPLAPLGCRAAVGLESRLD